MAAFVRPEGDGPHLRVVPCFADVFSAPAVPAIIATIWV
jgi:hypothetical protein